MTKTKNTVIEKNQPFSKSLFWRGQRQFYDEKGVEAWAGDVPFYITSNPFIAKCYAKMVLRFIQDWTRKYPDSIKDPFYIIELGAGSGQFSFYTLRFLEKLLQQFNLQHINVRYIMTDFTDNNIKFWKSHEKIIPFIEKNLVDFAIFDIENDYKINTLHNNFELSPDTVANPLIVFANYLFDSIINDIFEVKNKKIYESLVTLSSSQNNIVNGMPLSWKKVKIQHEEKLIDNDYYSDPLLNETLESYKNKINDAYLLFPIGCLKGIQKLNKMASGKLLLISSDKGYSTLYELNELEYPELDFHGSFSLMVNYHAISYFFKLMNGDAFLQMPRDGLATGVFSSGFKFDDLTETSYALKNDIEGFSPNDFFNLYELIEKISDRTDLKTLATVLCLSEWDPFLFEQMSENIQELFEKENSEIIDYIANHFSDIVENFYFVPQCDDIFFSIGVILYTIDQYEEAIKYFKLSLNYFSPSFELFYNLGLCYYYSKNYSLALETLNKALDKKPKNNEVKKFIATCKRKCKK